MASSDSNPGARQASAPSGDASKQDPSAVTYIYVGNAASQDITALELAPGGALRPVHTVAVPHRAGPGGSMPLAASPDGRFVFAAPAREPHELATYRVDAGTGRLTYAGSGPLAASMAYITTDRAGRFLLSASYHGDLVAVNPLGADGIAGETLQTVATVPRAHSVLAAPSNRHVLIASLGGDVILQQRFDPDTGTLSPNVPPVMSVDRGAGPRHLVLSPDGGFVYVANELDGSIHVFPYIAASGTLAPAIQTARALPDGFSGTPWVADIHITPDGRFLYVSERTSSTLAAFRLDVERGTVTSLGSHPTAAQPRSFAIDPSGRLLLAAGERSSSLVHHAIDQETGRLTRIGETPTGRNPTWVEVVRVAR